METEPNLMARRGNKHWRELSDSQVMEEVACPVLLLAMHAPESAAPEGGRAEHHAQEPPAESHRGEEEGIDRISTLPDVILGEIVSLLPTKDGARTRILSKRWLPVWHRAPLNLDLSELFTHCEDLNSVISRIVSTHEGTGKVFRAPWFYNYHFADAVQAWLDSPALNNLQEIEFYSCSNGPLLDAPPPLPVATFRFSSSLHVATLYYCSIPGGNAEMLRFPKLKKLQLSFVIISEGSLHSLIDGCPELECLLLDQCSFFRCVRINSACLISIAVQGNYHCAGFEEIIIEDAPSLERFFYFQWDMGLRVSVISAPKLETLGCHLHSDDSSRMVFGSTLIQGLDVISSRTVVSTIKILAVNMHILCLDTIIDLMKCFPCMEKLYVQPDYSRGTNAWCHKHTHLIKSLDIRLKKVVMFEYGGLRSQVNFAKFFIVNAKKLETMIFSGGPNNDELFIAKQHWKLQLENRASAAAEFHFITGKCYHDISHIKDVHALSRADPFEYSYFS